MTTEPNKAKDDTAGAIVGFIMIAIALWWWWTMPAPSTMPPPPADDVWADYVRPPSPALNLKNMRALKIVVDDGDISWVDGRYWRMMLPDQQRELARLLYTGEGRRAVYLSEPSHVTRFWTSSHGEVITEYEIDR